MARQLIALGFQAVALQGGYAAWRATQPVEPKGQIAVQRDVLAPV